MRRTPSDRYISYRLLEAPEVANDELIADLADELVFTSAAHLKRLRKGLATPEPFCPSILSDLPSQRFLLEKGLWHLYHPTPATLEARRLFENVRPRMAVQTLLAGSVPEAGIVEAAARHLNFNLSIEGLRQFAQVYWDVTSLTRVELARYVEAYLEDEEMAAVAGMPPAPDTAIRALFVIGVDPPAVDAKALAKDMLSAAALMHAGYLRERLTAPARATALHASSETIARLREAIAAGGGDQDELYEEVRRFKLSVLDIQNPSAKDVADGKAVPFPVAALLPYTEPVADAEDPEPRGGR